MFIVEAALQMEVWSFHLILRVDGITGLFIEIPITNRISWMAKKRDRERKQKMCSQFC